jgi:hypothetical protein
MAADIPGTTGYQYRHAGLPQYKNKVACSIFEHVSFDYANISILLYFR